MKIVTSFVPEKTILCALWMSDQLWHPQMNRVAVVGVRSGTETYIIPLHHYDAGSHVMSVSEFADTVKDCIIQTNDKKTFLHVFGDVGTVQQLGTDPQYGHNLAHPYLIHIDNIENAYQSVPLVKIAEWLDNILDTIQNTFTHNSHFFDVEYIPCLFELEKHGIHVNTELLSTHNVAVAKRYVRNNLMYANYNPFTTTGRASNSLGINFSALNKSTGLRKVFTSRFNEGSMLSVDFEAYHLRLIADDLGVVLPEGSIHTELAKIYFSTDTVTPEQYELSKQKTFEIIYGMTSDAPDLELFHAIKRQRLNLWGSYSRQNKILLPNGILTAVKDANPSKVFNYYVQALEVVKTIPKLRVILKQLESMQSKLVLYTYDGMLFDVHPDEDLSEFWPILEENKKFPIRRYQGSDYDTLKELI